jgi:leader peptidase (prepilin peptidase)/N-methyltransferase
VTDLALPGPLGIASGALLGALIGSFLNVCILRWGAEPKESIVSPRSHCPRCGKGLVWYENVPIVSWLLLRARCRGCGQPISFMYPLIELVTAGLWAYMAWKYGVTLVALSGAVFGTILLGIAMTDARNYIIPDEFTWGGVALGLLFSLTGGWAGLTTALLGAAVGFGLLWVVGYLGTMVFKEDAMGGGDIKMMAMVGAFLGWQGVLLTIFLGALAGSLVFVPLLLAGQKKLVPFGIFLAIGAAISHELGPAIIRWYSGYLVGA